MRPHQFHWLVNASGRRGGKVVAHLHVLMKLHPGELCDQHLLEGIQALIDVLAAALNDLRLVFMEPLDHILPKQCLLS
jgi:hypothetical protein